VAIPTALVGGAYATMAVIVGIARYPYVANTVITSVGTNIYQQILTMPSVFIDNIPYGQQVGFSMSSVIDVPATAGAYAYIPYIASFPFQGSWTTVALSASALTSSGTVLKR
jgi:hypothetical protein